MGAGRHSGDGGRAGHDRDRIGHPPPATSRAFSARVLEAVTEAVGAEEAGRIVGFKKGDMAEAAERLLEGRGWLPPVVRTGETLPQVRGRKAMARIDPHLPSEACDVAAE